LQDSAVRSLHILRKHSSITWAKRNDSGPEVLVKDVRERRSDLQFYATCHPGLEAVVAEELSGPCIAATKVEIGKAGVTFW
jgi:hypothetical protein